MRAMDISSYVVGNKLKIKVEEQRRLDFYREAYEKAEKVAKALRDSFPNIEVYLFGSLTTDMFELESDIDIAVKELLEEDYFKAYRIAEDIAESFSMISYNLNLRIETLMRAELR